MLTVLRLQKGSRMCVPTGDSSILHGFSTPILTILIALARAGKVKSQTPKVEPQEKTKVPKGRAKKRLIYTRRFVNVTLTGTGKRRVR